MTYSVRVTDTGVSGELARPPAVADAQLSAHVLSCPDAIDGGGSLCVANPSFDGTPALDLGNNGFNAPPWVSCNVNGPDVVSGTTAPGATDGTTFARFYAPAADGPGERASEPLCAALHAGVTYALKLDLALDPDIPPSPPPAFLKIWASTSSCSTTELLWQSPPLSAGWTTYCATLTPSADATHLTIGAEFTEPDAGSFVNGGLYVDHLQPVARCP
jgi:hypothetical protein